MNKIEIVNAKVVDSSVLRNTAIKCGTLDKHTPYTYWVVWNYFGDYCFVAKDNEKVVGFITCVNEGKKALIWQIGVLQEYRKRGISQLLIDALWEKLNDSTEHKPLVEVTIADGNVASKSAFETFCRNKGLHLIQRDYVTVYDENGNIEECEALYEIVRND